MHMSSSRISGCDVDNLRAEYCPLPIVRSKIGAFKVTSLKFWKDTYGPDLIHCIKNRDCFVI